MTRPDLQHPDATPQPHQQPVCAREGCDRRAVIATNMTPLCAKHGMAKQESPAAGLTVRRG
ncbi:MAG: hypothetical protein U5L06_00840 [Rhodovibrio sp.]|nr:hypothetical protein [Rhodovibrio sp.]